MLNGSTFGLVLREAAPTLSKRFFSCQSRTVQSDHINPSISSACHAYRIAIDGPILRSRTASKAKLVVLTQRCGRQVRAFNTTPRRLNSTFTTAAANSFSRSQNEETNTSNTTSAETDGIAKKSSFPKSSSNAVAYWLLASAASVFGIVVFGGLTRLTESGLSITEWKPVTGSLPPMSDADWESEFAKYRASPEFRVLNSRMTLDEFKSIYWMEWIHRVWGRAVGLTFVLPAAYFIVRKQVSRPMMLRLAGIAGLIGFQGFIGWWMVKSGLKDDLFQQPGSVPRVSQYRLATHLGTAFICYLAMVWNGLSILRTNKLLAMSTDQAASTLFSLRNPALRPFKISVALLLGLTFTTAMSGALVAGLDAGLIYNEFPYMGLGLTPPRSELFDKFYSRDPEQKDLIWRNFLENPSLVQLDHRILATTTFTSVMALWAYSRFSADMRAFLPRAAQKGIHGVVGFVWLQVILGISTLIYMVPLPLASAHQAGALALLTWTTVLGSRIWFPRHAAKLISQRIGAQRASSSSSYQYPAVPRVTPGNAAYSGNSREAPIVQASMSAVAAGVASLFMASAITAQRNKRSLESNSTPRSTENETTSELDTAKQAFLQKQRCLTSRV